MRDAFGTPDPNNDATNLDPTEPGAEPAAANPVQVVHRLSADLVLPLHKLDELRRTSSPVELFQLMRDHTPVPPSANQQTW